MSSQVTYMLVYLLAFCVVGQQCVTMFQYETLLINTQMLMYFCLLLSPAASKAKIKEAHKRIMLLNHPDRGMMLRLFCSLLE